MKVTKKVMSAVMIGRTICNTLHFDWVRRTACCKSIVLFPGTSIVDQAGALTPHVSLSARNCACSGLIPLLEQIAIQSLKTGNKFSPFEYEQADQMLKKTLLQVQLAGVSNVALNIKGGERLQPLYIFAFRMQEVSPSLPLRTSSFDF